MTNRFIVFKSALNGDLLGTNNFSISCVQVQGDIGYGVYVIDQASQREFLVALRVSAKDAMGFCIRVGAALTDESVSLMEIKERD